MDSSLAQSLLQALVHAKWTSPEKARQVQLEYQQHCRRGGHLTLAEFLLHEQEISPAKIHKARSLLQQGYYHCPSCKIVYPLPPGGFPHKRLCPQCEEELSFYQRDSQPSKAPLPDQREGKLEEIQKNFFPQPQPGSTSDVKKFKRIDSPEYPVLKTLGKGGFGTVYQVKDSLTGRKMALKVLKPEGQKKIKIKERFLREIQITSQLEHPNIMPLYESGYLEGGSLYFIMKEIRGETLKELMEERKKEKEGARNLHHMLEILLKVCDALEYAHSQGIVHRDLKPSNIAVGNFGEVIVLDWGIAKAVGVEEPEEVDSDWETNAIEVDGKTLTLGGMLGTPGYMAPEQAEGKEVTPQTDIHALGAILYKMLTFQSPYQGDSSARLVTLLTKSPPPPHQACPKRQIPMELSAIAMKCLEKNPRDRYESGGELKEDIIRYMEGFSVSAHQDNPLVATGKWIRRNRALAGGIALALLAAVASLVAFQIIEKREINEKIRSHLTRASETLESQKLSTAEELEEKFHRQYRLNGRETLAARRIRQRSLRKYMKARGYLWKAFDLDSDNNDIRRRLYELEKTIGELALLGSNFLLAEASFERCENLFPEKGKKLLEKLQRQKREREEAHIKAVGKIMAALKDPPGPGRAEEYIAEIVRMSRPEVVKILLSYVNSPHTWQRRVAIEALGKMGDCYSRYKGRDVIETLVERLSSLSVKEREEECLRIVWALARLRDSRANQPVLQKRKEAGQGSNFWGKTSYPFSWIPEPKKRGGEKTFRQWFKSGQRKITKGLYRQAIRDFNRAEELNLNSASLYQNRGIAYTKLGDYDKALRDLNRALELGPNQAYIYISRARVYKETKEIKKALADYEKALEINPRLPSVYENRGFLYLNRAEYSRAIRDFSQAIAYSSSPSSKLFEFRARAWAQMKKYKKAIADYNRAIELDPQSADSYNNRGSLYRKMKKYHRAQEDFNRAIELNPQLIGPYFNRGNLHRDWGKLKAAIADYTRAIEVAPKWAKPYIERGNVYRMKGAYQKALEDTKQALELNNKNPIAYRSYRVQGDIFLGLKRYNQAIASYTRSLEYFPKNYRVYNNRGYTYYLKGNFDRALTDYRKSIKVNPNQTKSYFNQIKIYRRRHLWRKAIAAYDQIIRLSPQRGILHYNRALCFYYLKDYKQAILGLKEAQKYSPQNWKIYWLRGSAWAKLGKNAKAAENFKKVFELNPDHPQKKKFRHFIEKFGQN